MVKYQEDRVQREYHIDTATGNAISTTSSSGLIKQKCASKSLGDLMKMQIMVKWLKVRPKILYFFFFSTFTNLFNIFKHKYIYNCMALTTGDTGAQNRQNIFFHR